MLGTWTKHAVVFNDLYISLYIYIYRYIYIDSEEIRLCFFRIGYLYSGEGGSKSKVFFSLDSSIRPTACVSVSMPAGHTANRLTKYDFLCRHYRGWLGRPLRRHRPARALAGRRPAGARGAPKRAGSVSQRAAARGPPGVLRDRLVPMGQW